MSGPKVWRLPLPKRRRILTTGFRAAAISRWEFRLAEGGSFGFPRVTDRITSTVERAGVFRCDGRLRWDCIKAFGIGWPSVDVERLFTDGGPHTAPEDVAVVVGHTFPRTSIDHRLMVISAGTFLALEGTNRNATKLDPFDGGPRFGLPIDDFDSVKTGPRELFEEFVFLMRAADAAAP